jgi:hypothetical protein
LKAAPEHPALLHCSERYGIRKYLTLSTTSGISAQFKEWPRNEPIWRLLEPNGG